jgi:hypothetical protein
MFLHTLTSPIFVDSLRWSHKVRDFAVVAYLSGVFVSRNIIYNILLDACTQMPMELARHEETITRQ